MGHYAAEMACGKCWQIVHCICPKPPPKYDWVVNKNFSAVSSQGLFYYPDMPRFDTKEEAEAAVPDLIRAEINALEAQIDMLNMMLNMKTDKVCEQCGNEKTECFCNGGYR